MMRLAGTRMLALFAAAAAMSGAALSTSARRAVGSDAGPRAAGASHSYRFRPGPGWSFAQVKRMARKRRNLLRAKGQHKEAVR